MKKSLFFYGWVIVAVAFVVYAVSYGIRFSFSVFYAAILNEFGWSRAGTAMIFSINILVYGITAPLAGGMIDKFGPRKIIPTFALLLGIVTAACSMAGSVWHLYFLYGVLMAFATCCVAYVPHSTLISSWFSRKRATALGITGSGNAGSFLLALLAQYLISTIGWRNAFVVLGGIAAVVLVPITVIFERARPQDMGLHPDGVDPGTEAKPNPARTPRAEDLIVDRKWATTEWTLGKAIGTRRLWMLFWASFLFFGTGVYLCLAHQVLFVTDFGYSPMFAATIFTLTGIISGVGSLSAFVSDRIGREITMTIAAILAMIGAFLLIMMIMIGGTAAPWLLYLYAITLGLGYGLGLNMITASAADLFQGRRFGAINGFVMMGFGIGGFIGPWFGGRVFDVMGSYFLAFVMVMVSVCIACLLVWLAAPRKVRRVAGKARSP